MVYRITIRRRAIKSLENINEPYYSRIKKPFIVLPVILDLRDLKSSKAETDTEFG